MANPSKILSLVSLSVALVNVSPPTAYAEQLEEIFVSATRSTAPAHSLNLSAYRLSAEQLTLAAATHLNEVATRLPAVWISRGNGQESLVSVRSPVLTGSGGCGSILMAQNNIPLRAPGFCNVNQLFDAHLEFSDAIETINGPTPATYGANGLHGMINLLAPAEPRNRDNAIALELGSHNYNRINITQKLGATDQPWLVEFTGISDGGYKKDAGYDQQKLSILRTRDAETVKHTSLLSVTNLNQETAGYIQGDDAYKDSSVKRDNPNPEAFRDAYAINAFHRIDSASDIAHPWTVTIFARHNDMRFLQHYLPWQAIEETGHTSIGLQSSWQTTWAGGDVQVGLDTQLTRGYLKETQPQPFSPNQPQGAHYDYDVDANTSAIYGLYTKDMNAALSWSSGLRFESTSYDYNNRLSDGSVCEPAATACRFFRTEDSTDRFSDWSAHTGLLWQLNDDHAFRIRVASGYRPPETSELYRLQNGQTAAQLDSESARSLELGWRASFEELELDASIYRMNKTDVIFQDANRYYVTGAKTRHEGFELKLRTTFAGPWNADFVTSFGSHEYSNNPGYLGINESIVGNAIDTAPEWMASGRVRYTQENWQAELEGIYLDRYATEPTNSNWYEGHRLINLRATRQWSQSWSTSLRVMNLSNTDYAERADFGFGNERFFVGEPRSLFVTVTYNP
jgi:iron complex outermembrane receptor protein